MVNERHLSRFAVVVSLCVVVAVTGSASANRGAHQWPARGQYFKAMQNPRALHPKLRRGKVERDAKNFPVSRSGALNSAYKLEFPRTNGSTRDVAVRFLHPPPGTTDRANPEKWRARYEGLNRYLDSVETPPEIVEVRWLDNAIRVGSEYHGALVMPWVEGRSLDRWISARLGQSRARDLGRFAHNFRILMRELHDLKIAHGDLHPGNIIIERGTGLVRLIDYDAMYVPTLKDMPNDEIGHPNFQHPYHFRGGLRPRKYGPEIDNFSALSIYLSALALSVEPSLWKYHRRDGETNLIFQHEDYAKPGTSRVFEALAKVPNKRVRDLTKALAAYAKGDPERVPDLEKVIAKWSGSVAPWYRRASEKPTSENRAADNYPDPAAWYQR